jgi:hypothetical protein
MPVPQVRGSCLCGAVAYAVTAESGSFQYCHCSRCRKTGGAAHAANLIVPAGEFRWLRGEEHVIQYVHEEASRFCNAFCRTCGSKLPWTTRDHRWVVVTAGTLDDDPGTRPLRNIFWGSRASWYLPPADLPAFEELPPRNK